MKPLKIAVIGAGFFGRNHIRLLSDMPEARLVAVADADRQARQYAADSFGARTVADPRELIGQIDAAVLAVPTRLHHRLGIELLEADVHLMVEKPLATTVAEARSLVATATKRQRVLQVGHIERFNPALEAAVPHLGPPKLIEARRTAPHKFRSTDIGVVLDLMIHDLDVVLSLVKSPVKQVEALGLSLFGRFEDLAQARLRFDNGCIATLTASRASYVGSRIMHIWSTQGFASIDFGQRLTTLVKPSEKLVNRKLDAEQLSSTEQEYLKDHLFEDLLPMERIEAAETNQLEAELHDFITAVRHGRQPRVTGEHGLQALIVADRIVEAIQHHAWDGSPEGRIGPSLTTSPHVLQGPHWHRRPAAVDRQHREAG